MFRRYRLLETLTKNFKILSNLEANADAVVTAIALYLYFLTGELKTNVVGTH